jgi:leucyl-tRNA synthetase
LKEEYQQMRQGEMDAYHVGRYVAVFLQTIAPICPHFAQYCWTKYVKDIYPDQPDLITEAGWPKVSGPTDIMLKRQFSYLKNTKHSIN